MNLRERKALLAKKSAYVKLNAQLTAKRAEGAKLKLKASDTTVELTDEELEALNSDAQACLDACEDLQNQINDLGDDAESTQEDVDAEAAEIESEEASLKAAAAAGMTQKSKNITSKKGHATMSYLKTKKAGIDLLQMLQSHNGQSMKAFQNDWVSHLATKDITVNADTGLDDMLPTSYVTAIKNAFVDGMHGILDYVKIDPRYVATFGFNKNKVKGRGHKAGKEKKNVKFAFEKITLDADTIYAKYMFDYAQQKKDTDGVYVDYVMAELAKAVVRAIEEAILVGDGLEDGNEEKITGITSIAEETEEKLVSKAEAAFATATYNQDIIESIVAGLDKIEAPGEVVIFTSKKIARKIRAAKDAEGRFIDPNWAKPITEGQEFDIMGYTAFVYDFMDEEDVPMIGVANQAYTLNGDVPNADRFDWYDVRFNQQHVEYAGVTGGRLTEYKGAVVFSTTKP